MKPDARRLLRLTRLERIRDVARLDAVGKAAIAERQYSRQSDLASRSQELVDGFGHRREFRSAADLQDIKCFHAGLLDMHQSVCREVARARQTADLHMAEVALSTRKYDQAADQRRSAAAGFKKKKIAEALARSPNLARTLNNKS